MTWHSPLFSGVREPGGQHLAGVKIPSLIQPTRGAMSEQQIPPNWRKSSYSQAGSECVEVETPPARICVHT
jgi:hypothetical protein